MKRALLAEALGTFTLVFAGTGAVVVDASTGGQISHVGVALTFGLVVTAVIYALGGVSGAHINPAVTLAMAVTRRITPARAAAYILAQCLGAVAASLAVLWIFGDHAHLGATLPRGTDLQSLALEAILTCILMLVILGAVEGGTAHTLAGIAIGATVGLEALFAGPISGASMNPARSLGPVLVSALCLGGDWAHFWVYSLGPISGALLGAFLWGLMRNPETVP